jgi:2-dehydropantoate 2-reductase
MCVMMPAVHVEPGSVDAPSWPTVGLLDLGRYPHGVDDRSRRVAADLSASGFRSEAVADIMRWKRAKLLVNLATAVRAACGPESGDGPLEAAARASVVADLRQEAELCFARAGASVPTDEERSARWDGAIQQRPIEGRPYVAGSSWQSLTRRTGQVETDYLNGEIVLLGRLHGVPTPANLVVQRVTGDAARRRLGAGRHSVLALRGEIDRLGISLSSRPVRGSALPPR